MAACTNSEGSLLGMAPETRLRIYSYLFAGSQIRLHLPERSAFPIKATKILEDFPYAIIFTCRLLNAEALDLLYSRTTLRVCTMGSRLIDLNALPIPTQFRGKCRTLAIDNDNVNSKPHVIGAFPCLQTLTIERCLMRLNNYAQQPVDYYSLTGDELMAKAIYANRSFGDWSDANFTVLLRVIFHDRNSLITEVSLVSFKLISC